MITDYIGGEGSAETPKNDYVIYGWPLIDQEMTKPFSFFNLAWINTDVGHVSLDIKYLLNSHSDTTQIDIDMPFPSAEIHGCTFGLLDSMNSPTQDKVAVPSPYIALFPSPRKQE